MSTSLAIKPGTAPGASFVGRLVLRLLRRWEVSTLEETVEDCVAALEAAEELEVDLAVGALVVVAVLQVLVRLRLCGPA